MSLAKQITEWLPLVWVVVGLGTLYFLANSGLAEGLTSRVKKFSGFGVDFEFSEVGSRKFKSDVESALSSARSELDAALAKEIRVADLRGRLSIALQPLSDLVGARGTIHVEDPLFSNWLYQAVDYVPSGGGSKRRFDARSGIIGLAWRLAKDQSWSHPKIMTPEQFAKQWGMTLEQAGSRKETDGGKVLVARVVRHEHRPVGILYVDCSVPDHLDGAQLKAAEESVFAKVMELSLDDVAKQLDGIIAKIRASAPQIDLDNIT